MQPAMLGAFLDGVRAIERMAGGLADEDWARPTPCPEWTLADLVGHVRCVVADYNAVLDAALDGGPGPVLLGADLAQHNTARLAALPPAAPVVHVAAFGLDARRFAARSADRWYATVFDVPDGDAWTVGDYVGFCALECHVHAWDLASGAGIAYRPRCVRALTGWWRQRLPHMPLYPNGRHPNGRHTDGRHTDGCRADGCRAGGRHVDGTACSWSALLRASGRAPAVSSPSLRHRMVDSRA